MYQIQPRAGARLDHERALGGSLPGGNRASTEPPKPPPTMRAPSAPARHRRGSPAQPRGPRPRSRHAGCGGRRRAARRARRGRRARGRRRRHPRARSRRARGGPGGRAGRGGPRRPPAKLAKRLHSEPRGGAAALGAAPVVPRCREASRGARVERREHVAAQREVDRAVAEIEHVEADRLPLLAEQRRELVEQAGVRAAPVALDPRAEPRERARLGRLEPAAAQSARQSATERAADDDSPAPRGTSPGISSGRGAARFRHAGARRLRRARSGASRSGAPGRPGCGGRISSSSAKRSPWERSSAWATIAAWRRPGPRATVTPRSMANGRQSPAL